MFIESLCHTKGTWAGKPFELIDWQEQIIRDLFGTLKPNGYRQFNTAYVEIPKKMGKSELAAAVALLLCCGDGEERAEVYGCAADRQQATIVFDVAADMVRMWCGIPAAVTGGVPHVYRSNTAGVPEEHRTCRGQSPAEPCLRRACSGGRGRNLKKDERHSRYNQSQGGSMILKAFDNYVTGLMYADIFFPSGRGSTACVFNTFRSRKQYIGAWLQLSRLMAVELGKISLGAQERQSVFSGSSRWANSLSARGRRSCRTATCWCIAEACPCMSPPSTCTSKCSSALFSAYNTRRGWNCASFATPCSPSTREIMCGRGMCWNCLSWAMHCG